MSNPIKSIASSSSAAAHKQLVSPGPSRLRHAFKEGDDEEEEDDDDDDDDDDEDPSPQKQAPNVDHLSGLDSDVSSLSDEPDELAEEEEEEEMEEEQDDEEEEEEEDGSAGETGDDDDDDDDDDEDQMEEDDYEDEDGDQVVSTRRPSASGPSTPAAKAPIKIRLRLSPETVKRNASAKASSGATKAASRTAAAPRRASSNLRWKAADERKSARPQRGAAEEGNKKRKADEESESDLEEGDMSTSIVLPKTARQLAKEREDDEDDDLVALPMTDSSKKLQLTESEMALRKSEMARRRRNQNEKKLEDDKRETIDRLLKKQVSKRSTRDKGKEGDGSDEEGGNEDRSKAGQAAARRDPREPKVMFRTVHRIDAVDGVPRSFVALPQLRQAVEPLATAQQGETEGQAEKEGSADVKTAEVGEGQGEEEKTPVVVVETTSEPDPAAPYHQAWSRAFGGVGAEAQDEVVQKTVAAA